MDFHSKYDVGQTVWSINQQRKKEWQPCAFCKAEGKVTGADGTEKPCPVCFQRKGRDVYRDMQWDVTESVTIGQIQIRYTGGPRRQERTEERYMCLETGIGNGAIWEVDLLWPTQDEAQAECDRRNADGSE